MFTQPSEKFLSHPLPLLSPRRKEPIGNSATKYSSKPQLDIIQYTAPFELSYYPDDESIYETTCEPALLSVNTLGLQ